MDEQAGARWFKSTWSGEGDNCVEVAFLASGRVGIRDSKNPAGGALVVSPSAFTGFIAAAASGELNPR